MQGCLSSSLSSTLSFTVIIFYHPHHLDTSTSIINYNNEKSSNWLSFLSINWCLFIYICFSLSNDEEEEEEESRLNELIHFTWNMLISSHVNNHFTRGENTMLTILLRDENRKRKFFFFSILFIIIINLSHLKHFIIYYVLVLLSWWLKFNDWFHWFNHYHHHGQQIANVIKINAIKV